MTRFQDKVVVVTGAAGGIGRAAAVRFAQQGANVVAVDLGSTDLAGTVAAVEAAGSRALAVSADVTDESSVAAYFAAAVSGFGGVDVLFNNAGIEGPVMPLTDTPVARFDQVLAVNVRGVWLGMKHAAPLMAQRGGGAIVNVSSVAGLGGTPGLIAYGASKHAVIGMTKSAAIELAPLKVRVNAVCPAPIETAMMRSIEKQSVPDDPQSVHDRLTETIPLGRYGEADEVADLVCFLCSDEARYITGSIVPIDGGMKAR